MLRIGIAGCGRASQIHLARLLDRGDVEVVGLADPNPVAAKAMADSVPQTAGPVPSFTELKEMLARVTPDVLAIFAPHRAHYRLAMDGLQAGCHVFIEKPLSTNAQEADDIVKLARARGRIVGVGHQYRLRPSLIEARDRLRAGTIGTLRLVTATLSSPWLARHQETADAWRLDPRQLGGGILADAGDHLLDAFLWLTGEAVIEVAAFQSRLAPGLDVVTAAIVRLGDGTPATLGLSGVCASNLFELTFFGETGRIRVSDASLAVIMGAGTEQTIALQESEATIDGDFVAAVEAGRPPCCPADQALDTARLQEAIARSSTSGQVVRLA
ncbi:MAG: putative dehydrogenase [Planctomycetota bacterium]|nr:putative dehydrogenase [Planctomycetota bacterium]